ncbi:hypothetical protein [Trinickia fusca]|uniref:GlsB/YeaQ/YmgE family stress response membrane protein n=1 Tax=Trinickia fusca TaxID=2419777 RepID=A0A494WZJ7_9BURK|nr:hypothetical protein [Trinickia fusca]RKP43958.1 hypothetical protein D7S89_23780 [Trinickia fusca]
MGWPGIVFLGVAVGLFGWWLHPLRRASRIGVALAIVLGAVAASAAKMAGSVTGLFYDGGTLEWPVCTACALALVALTVGLAARR